jgi:hypothetical protein
MIFGIIVGKEGLVEVREMSGLFLALDQKLGQKFF